MSLLAAATAAQPTALEKLKQIPTEFWVRTGLAILVIVALVIFLRKIAKVNKVLLAVGVAVGLTIIGFNWIYERNEPPWATPAVQWLAGFFPSKGRPGERIQH
jgi:hypothetical protein